ncbi:hypothetical protein [Enterococcus faecium]|nr:hypothetical protein [Enterococcus faecium]
MIRKAYVVRNITQKIQAIASVANTTDNVGATINQNLQKSSKSNESSE